MTFHAPHYIKAILFAFSGVTLFFPEKAAGCNAEFLNHGLGNKESVQKISASFASDLHVRR
jgi:hypothetical protein